MYLYGTNVLFVCRLCKDSFQLIDDFIEHKKEEHSVEFRSSNCIVFEDILILNTSNDEEKNCGTMSTVKEKGNPVPSLNVPLVGIENNLTEVDVNHSHEPIPHDPADAFDPFPVFVTDYQNDGNPENFSYRDEDDTCDSLEPNHDDNNEAFDLPQASASADASFNFIEPKMELTDYEEDQKINTTAINVMTQGPENPNVLLKKLSSMEIQNYSRLQNQQDTVQAATEVTSGSRCELCLKNFNSEAELEIHWRVCELDNNEGHMCCSPCKMVFTSKWARNMHNMTLHGTKDQERELCTFTCNVCQKLYSQKDLLIRHMESHKETDGGKKPFKCNECSASFFTKSYLSRHQSSHSFTRPFQCPEPGCEKAFKREHHLRLHLKYLHSNILELFKCREPNCTSTFTRKESLARHLRTCHKTK